MSRSITRALAPITRSTAAIESAFVKAGEGLNRGLAAFAALNGDLAALGAELDDGASGFTSASLDRLAQSIAAVGERLPEDARILSELVAGSEAIAAHFAILDDNMRMITIISRSARIEAVAFDDARLGLDNFTRAITEQISTVLRDIRGCAADHAKLMALLRDVAQTQAAFVATSGAKLLALAAELGQASGAILRQRQDGGALMRDVAARSARVTRATGSALVSLQVGDATRQRLEHVAKAIGAAGELAGADPAGQATAAVLCRVAAAQLGDAAAALDAEAGEVLQALGLVADETSEVVAVGTATYGRGRDGSGSVMAELRSRFVAAMDLVRSCEATRQTVERAIGELRAMLDALSGTIATLGTTSRELVLVGMNVGLKAARLGSGGHSLVVAAEELKRLAGDISVHSHELLPVFQRVQRVCHHFDRGEGETSHGLDRDFQAIIEDLERRDGKVADRLRSLGDVGRDFAARLAAATAAFADVAGMKRALDEAADLLWWDAGEPAFAGPPPAAAAERVEAVMHPLYTMAREREIHADAMADLLGSRGSIPARAA